MVDGQPWPAVGHGAPQGSQTFNPFGADFRAAGLMWTAELCAMDSDGDGRTNGEELGDPDCVWQVGQTPTRTVDITHPGFENIESDGETPSNETSAPSLESDAGVVEQLSLPSWLIAHICCMMLSWGFLLPIGALMAISFRGLLSKDALWFRLHIIIQVLGVGLTVAGFTIAFVNISTHFKDTHQIFGTIIFAGGLFQAALGFIRPHKPNKGEQTTTLRLVWEYCHKGFGRIVILLAWINIFLGVKLIKNFFAGVPANVTSTIFAGMNAILGIQAVLCLILTFVSIFVRTKDKSQVEKDSGESSAQMNTTTRQDDLEEQT